MADSRLTDADPSVKLEMMKDMLQRLINQTSKLTIYMVVSSFERMAGIFEEVKFSEGNLNPGASLRMGMPLVETPNIDFDLVPSSRPEMLIASQADWSVEKAPGRSLHLSSKPRVSYTKELCTKTWEKSSNLIAGVPEATEGTGNKPDAAPEQRQRAPRTPRYKM